MARQVYLGILLALFGIFGVAKVLAFRKAHGLNPVTIWKGGSRAEGYIGHVFLVLLAFYFGGGILTLVRPTWVACLHGFPTFDRGWIEAAGFVLSLGAMTLISIAQRTMGASWRIGIDSGSRTDLVTIGIFQHCRNPIFTGMILVAMGVFLILPSVATLIAAAAAYLTINFQIRLEEDFLEKTHGDVYREYLARAGRFGPRLFLAKLP